MAKRRWLTISKEDLEQFYTSGLSARQIGNKCGFSRQAVDRAMKKHGLQARDSAAQQTALNETKKIVFTYEQEQLVLGSLLGDACIYNNRFQSNKTERIISSYKLIFAHSQKHEEYLNYKRAVLPGCEVMERLSGKGSVIKHYAFSHTPTLKPYYDLCIKDGVKRVNKEWLDKVDLRGIAWFYQDDGYLSLNKRGTLAQLGFCINSFLREDRELIKQKLSSLGLETKCILRATFDDEAVEDQYILLCCKNQMAADFLEKLYPFHVPCMAYKFRLITGGRKYAKY